MSKALPGQHYCKPHQGNHSHYSPDNCAVCRLLAILAEARSFVDRHSEDWYVTGQELLANIDETVKNIAKGSP